MTDKPSNRTSDAEDLLRVELTQEQAQFIEQTGWVHSGGNNTRVIHLPAFYKHETGNTYIAYRAKDIDSYAHKHREEWDEVKDAIEAIHEREYLPITEDLTLRLSEYKSLYHSEIQKYMDLRTKIDLYETAMKKVIEMNYQNAEDQYGDREKAKGWGCVSVLETALKGSK